jgi:hypothetical protein
VNFARMEQIKDQDWSPTVGRSFPRMLSLSCSVGSLKPKINSRISVLDSSVAS